MNVLEELKGAETVGITGHIRPDGDCIGSCMGLYSYLKDNCPQLDVTVYLETPGSEFHYIRDIDKIQTIPDIKKKYDVFFVLDCSSLDRIEPFHNCFENAKKLHLLLEKPEPLFQQLHIVNWGCNFAGKSATYVHGTQKNRKASAFRFWRYGTHYTLGLIE